MLLDGFYLFEGLGINSHDVLMSRYRRSKAGGATYFFTVNTYLRQPILTHPAVRATLREAIEHP